MSSQRCGVRLGATSCFWKAFCSLLGATVSLTSGYDPQAGQTECLNQELETSLRCLVSQNPATWSRHLIWVEYAHNTLPCSSSGLYPFQCAYGYQPSSGAVPRGEVLSCLGPCYCFVPVLALCFTSALVPDLSPLHVWFRPPP